MDVYLPIANLAVNGLVIVLLGAATGILSGIFVGALYGLLGLGLSLSWGLLRLIKGAFIGYLWAKNEQDRGS